MQTQAQRNNQKTFLISCNKCDHIRVCTIHRAVAPLLAKWTDESRPFEADQIASICGEYLDQELAGSR